MTITDYSAQNLKTLPKLEVGLEWLNCNNNQLTELKDLPVGLKVLNCYNNLFPPEEKEKIKKYCKEKNIYLSI